MTIPSPSVLEVERLTKRYRSGLVANLDVDLSVGRGEVFGLLGPNGAGKSTLVGQVLGLLAPSSGSIRVGGIDVLADPPAARRRCSYQPQGSVPIDGLTPLEAVELVGRLRGGSRVAVRRRAHHLLTELELGEWAAQRRPLSGGVARLVGFCMAAVVPGELVVLDEPTNDVDPLRRRLLWRMVRVLADGGSSVVLVTHNVLEAERCVDRLAILDRGRVAVSGTPAALRAHVGAGLRLEIVTEPDRPIAAPPAFLSRPFMTGSRLVAEVDAADVERAVAWADGCRRSGEVAEFLLAPVSLEDVYVRAVAAAAPPATGCAPALSVARA